MTRWVTGRFVTALAGDELRYALEAELVEHVEALCYYAGHPLFRTYQCEWWDRRQAAYEAGNVAMAGYYKLLMNGLYGKFGQLTGRWLDRPNMAAPVPWGPFFVTDPTDGRLREYRAIGGNVQEAMELEDHSESQPVIAACITAALRQRMVELRRIAGSRSVLYSDTDSIHVTAAGYHRLADAGQIGGAAMGTLRCVEVIDTAEYRGPRNYTANGRNVVAGLKASAEAIAPDVFLQSEWQRLDSILAERPAGRVVVKEQIFTVPGHTPSDGGDVAGWAAVPLVNDLSLTDELAAIIGMR